MATSTFDRPLVLTEKGVDRLIELNKEWEKNPPPPIPPVPKGLFDMTDEDEELLDKCYENYLKTKKE